MMELQTEANSFSLQEVFSAYYEARRHKRGTASQLSFELCLEDNLVLLWKELCRREYVVGSSICFIIRDSVLREVFAADFRDRVVHHILYNRLSPFFERRFICDSYSCRPGKGTLYGVQRLEHHIRSCSKNYTEDCYVLKLDIKGYFMHIDRRILYGIIERSLPGDFPERESTLWLCRLVIGCEPVVNCRIKGNIHEWDALPRDKSLFHTESDCGMPIGNLTSQLFSNIYLNEFDQWIKRTCGIRHYGRYVDDFYIVHEDKSFLQGMIPRIRDFLRRELALTLHPHKVYLQHCTRGVRFLGFAVYPFHRLPSKKILGRAKRRFFEIEAGEHSPEGMRSVINSYLGMFRHSAGIGYVKFLIATYRAPFSVGYYSRVRDNFVFKLHRALREMTFSKLT